MRHKKNRLLELKTGPQKTTNVIRNLLTSLVTHGQIVTTPKKAKVLKAEADKFFSRLLKSYDNAGSDVDGKRITDSRIKGILYTEDAGKKVSNELLPRFREEKKTSGFVSTFKLGPRPGDAAEKILVRLNG